MRISDWSSDVCSSDLRAPEVLDYPGLSESRFTYRISLNYKPTDDVMLFVNPSTGYKSGGYNSGVGVPALANFDPLGNLTSTRSVVNRRSDEGSVGKGWFLTGGIRGSPEHSKKNTN